MCREETIEATNWAVFPSSGVRTIFSAPDILLPRMEKASARNVDCLAKDSVVISHFLRQTHDRSGLNFERDSAENTKLTYQT